MIDIPALFRRLVNHSEPADFSQSSWSAAFDALCEKLAREYPFTYWKGIHWNELKRRFQARIELAESTRDVRAYYLALRDFLYSIPDAQIELWGDDWGQFTSQVGGGFGLSLTRVESWDIVAGVVVADGPADLVGVRVGARILAWNGQPIQDALEQAPILWAERPAATRAIRQLEQLRFLMRAAVGAGTDVSFQNREDSAPKTATMIATTENHEMLPSTARAHKSSGGAVKSRIMPSGIGYITVGALGTDGLNGMRPNRIHRAFRKAMREFIRNKVVGVVVDLRQCTGGDHRLASNLAGFFHPHPLFYAATEVFNDATGAFEIRKPDPQTIMQVVPQEICYEGPVAALIGPRTGGGGEGIARAIQRNPHGTVIGFGASGGMFSGVINPGVNEVRMPLGYVVTFPASRSVNQDGVIQIESNRFGEGGVVPNIRVPLNEENFNATFVEKNDVELTYAVYEITNAARRAATRPAPARPRRLAPVPESVRGVLALVRGHA